MKQKIDKCIHCKTEIPGNPRYVLMEMTMIGYVEKNFCCLKCFLNYIFKKYKKKFEKWWL